MAFSLSPQTIAQAIQCPAADVAANWPLIEGCFNDLKMDTPAVCIAVLATVAVETANKFLPIHEYGSNAYFEQHYQGRKDLGNVHPGDGVKYHGRGFVQTTGEANYERDGRLIGVDLVTDPDKALDPYNASALLAAFFWEHHISDLAQAGDWVGVRHKINGGTNGLDKFLLYVSRLQKALLTI